MTPFQITAQTLPAFQRGRAAALAYARRSDAEREPVASQQAWLVGYDSIEDERLLRSARSALGKLAENPRNTEARASYDHAASKLWQRGPYRPGMGGRRYRLPVEPVAPTMEQMRNIV